MKKFLKFCSLHFQNTHSHRGERIVWILIDAIPAFIMIQLWSYLEHAGRMSADQAVRLSMYYLLTLTISRLTSCHYEDWLMKDIKDGVISTVLIKPMKYPVFLIAGEIMWRLTGMLYLLPVFLFIGFRAEYLRIMVLDPITILAALCSLILAFVLRFLISWIISLAAFWIDEASFLSHFKWGLEGFLGGQFLPLTFFPLAMQHVSQWSPFFLFYQVPIGLLTGTIRLQDLGHHIGVGMVWLGILSVASVIEWKQAMKKYSAAGG